MKSPGAYVSPMRGQALAILQCALDGRVRARNGSALAHSTSPVAETAISASARTPLRMLGSAIG
jgi:hypothetical protein